MKCPYHGDKDFDCPFVDTLDMTKTKSCTECEFKRFTLDEVEEIEDWKNFMMGL